mmetsp:Transcript_73355/g.203595  ORF Transcript_73355/g.203595 Transcript_73355/m.203595 type:complete len:207 (-) Transcript_73355:737-1357(-)
MLLQWARRAPTPPRMCWCICRRSSPRLKAPFIRIRRCKMQRRWFRSSFSKRSGAITREFRLNREPRRNAWRSKNSGTTQKPFFSIMQACFTAGNLRSVRRTRREVHMSLRRASFCTTRRCWVSNSSSTDCMASTRCGRICCRRALMRSANSARGSPRTKARCFISSAARSVVTSAMTRCCATSLLTLATPRSRGGASSYHWTQSSL